MAKTTQAASQESKQGMLDHLLALRKVLVISAGAILAAFLLVFYFAVDYLMAFITGPIAQRGIEIIYTAMSEALMTKIKVALLAGIVAASPVIVWQVWSFIKPALYEAEIRAAKLLFVVILLLFLLGVVFCYGAVYFLAVDFFLISGENLATPMLSIDNYVGFLFGFVVPFGLAFELPVAVWLTTRLGWTTPKMLASKRKFVILAIAIVAAILTPPDVVSQTLLGVPMVLLYEVGILVSRTVRARKKDKEA